MVPFARYAVNVSAAAALLAGCGALRQAQNDMQPPIAAPGAAPHRASLSFHVLHSFGRHATGSHNHGGAFPDAGLINVHGTLYGTTAYGGHQNNGVVYSITTAGMKRVLHRFLGPNAGDGAIPIDDLINVNGTLYSTTWHGGSGSSCVWGTVFSVSTTGTEKVLHSFCLNDGQPLGGVVNVKGTLYGTSGGSGIVYSISPSGAYKVVYTFGSGNSGPIGSLLNVNGTLYGVTLYGGTACYGNGGCGTVYSLTRSGKEKILHSFQGRPDGWFPTSGLINVNGTLYGTTYYGGNPGCINDAGCGIVYSITTSGTEHVLYRFNGGTDGGNPDAGLLALNGTLYGTTYEGGTYGLGTVFSVSTSGSEQVLHSFGGSDGEHPEADLADVNGTLYGTTHAGGVPQQGCQGQGCGTVFALTP